MLTGWREGGQEFCGLRLGFFTPRSPVLKFLFEVLVAMAEGIQTRAMAEVGKKGGETGLLKKPVMTKPATSAVLEEGEVITNVEAFPPLKKRRKKQLVVEKEEHVFFKPKVGPVKKKTNGKSSQTPSQQSSPSVVNKKVSSKVRKANVVRKEKPITKLIECLNGSKIYSEVKKNHLAGPGVEPGVEVEVGVEDLAGRLNPWILTGHILVGVLNIVPARNSVKGEEVIQEIDIVFQALQIPNFLILKQLRKWMMISTYIGLDLSERIYSLVRALVRKSDFPKVMKVCDKYPRPGNVPELVTPELPQDVDKTIDQKVVKEDKRLKLDQMCATAATTALGKGLDLVLIAKEQNPGLAKVGDILVDCITLTSCFAT